MKIAKIKGSELVIAIGGFKYGKVEDPKALVTQVSKEVKNGQIQLVNAEVVAGFDHLYMAAVNAVKALETGVAISKSVTVETLLYASTQDQIVKALEFFGITRKTYVIALIVFASTIDEATKSYQNAAKLLHEEDDTVLDITPDKFQRLKKIYEVTDLEMSTVGGWESLERLIIEKGALLSLRR